MTLLQRLRDTLGTDAVLSDIDAMAPYAEERRRRYTSTPLAVVLPRDTAAVAATVRLACTHHTAIVAQGGNTGLCGGAVATPGQLIVNLARLNQVRDIDTTNFTLTAEAGCILADLQRISVGYERFFPLSLGAEGSCQIGGNLATNAGGINVLRYGNARELVLGLEVVLADGSMWDGLNALRKNNTGYDLKQLFIGAEGTLGIITAAVLKLFPAPQARETALVALTSVAAGIDLLAELRAASDDRLSSFELIPRIAIEFACRHIDSARDPLRTPYPWYALIGLTASRPGDALRTCLEQALAAAFDKHQIADAVLAQSEAQAAALWHLREALVAAQKFEGASIKHDVAVPVSKVADLIQRASIAVETAIPGARVYAFGHAGDGNIHFNISQPSAMDRDAFLNQWQTVNTIVHDIVHDLNGSFSAEHGVGLLKLNDMRHYKSPLELRLMTNLKQSLDPLGILNPGKLLPTSD